jgi:uncharacterized protein YbjQ (UPF0145 family)
MEFQKFVEWAFLGVISGGVIYGVSVLSKLHDDLKDISKEFAKFTEQLRWHERWLEQHDTDINVHIKREK